MRAVRRDAMDNAVPLEAPARIALLGNALPRLCGLATFTSHVQDALVSRFPGIVVDHYAMVDPGRSYRFPQSVTGTIDQEEPASYRAAARQIVASGAELLWVQHEFGIYGGPAGAWLLELLDAVDLPVVASLHTVLEAPNDDQRRVMAALTRRVARFIVMAERARATLRHIYGVASERITVIPHGVPARRYEEPAAARARLGLERRPTILTFGLLSPGKGLEAMIAAMPTILEQAPDALYRIVGATHPHLVAHEGEAYRERLQALAAGLGVEAHLRWDAHFLDEAALLDCIAAADVYVTPYGNPAQITSGTLSYAFGLGKPIVSTPYVHAAELLTDGRGRLVGFGDVGGLAHAVGELLANEDARRALAHRTSREGQAMTWRHMVERCVASFEPLLSRVEAVPTASDPAEALAA
ncbi:glycosyltransferase family 4 protein [Sphingomonas sp. UNC305MFCol5.2]|uniref:glycosyltransferase family 4 protein n=1 Tax=Sphingomonas sp. UNC305MFCol5.2 TaxID=1449076 RepID=UPI000B0C1F16|nr:glycosyltransferase family 4 protein [Sphingomonas sp. UNC305MFCol5.2]